MSIFITLYQQKDPGIIRQNEHFFGLLDAFPISPGHVLLIPHRHVIDFFDLSTSEQQALIPSLESLKKAIQETNLQNHYKQAILNPLNEQAANDCQKALKMLQQGKKRDGQCNIGINNGPLAGRTIDHAHIHLIPRYQNDNHGSIEGIKKGIKYKH